MNSVALTSLTPVEQDLIHRAIAVRQKSYAPYSNYKVGAALLDEKGQVYTGCNVESADYSLTTHAEMDAINSMVKSGVLKLKMIAVVVKSDVGYGMPCGLCRQKIREFAGGLNVHVIGVNLDDQDRIKEIYISTLKDLLPYSFGPDFL